MPATLNHNCVGDLEVALALLKTTLQLRCAHAILVQCLLLKDLFGFRNKRRVVNRVDAKECENHEK
jgi:hypothetical protein